MYYHLKLSPRRSSGLPAVCHPHPIKLCIYKLNPIHAALRTSGLPLGILIPGWWKVIDGKKARFYLTRFVWRSGWNEMYQLTDSSVNVMAANRICWVANLVSLTHLPKVLLWSITCNKPKPWKFTDSSLNVYFPPSTLKTIIIFNKS